MLCRALVDLMFGGPCLYLMCACVRAVCATRTGLRCPAHRKGVAVILEPKWRGGLYLSQDDLLPADVLDTLLDLCVSSLRRAMLIFSVLFQF